MLCYNTFAVFSIDIVDEDKDKLLQYYYYELRIFVDKLNQMDTRPRLPYVVCANENDDILHFLLVI